MTDPFQTSSTSPAPDFSFENHGTLFLLIPRTAPADIWIEQNLPPDHMTFADAVVIEARYVLAILVGLHADGFSVVPR
jgi:hypothetical protein